MASISQEQITQAYQNWTKELNLSDEQKQQFQNALNAAAAKLDEMAAAGQTVDGAKARELVRSSVEKWLTPDQLATWDKGVASAKSFLGL